MLVVIYYGLVMLTAVASLGGIAYYLIAVAAVRRRQRQHKADPPLLSSMPPISLLKPLCGADAELETHLESFFRQDYPQFEILFAVRNESDPAIPIARNLMKRYPNIDSQIIFTGEPPYANAKVYSMEKMAAEARFEILSITDSDTSVEPHYLKALAKEFEPEDVGVVTNVYRGVAGQDFWSQLEALGMTAEFMAGVITADRLEGMKFAIGPSMAINKDCLREIGGFAAMAEYLADDFLLGQWAAEAGWRVILSTHTISHHASATGFWKSFIHRLRWNRSSRYSRPSGYIGQGFTYGLPWAILLFCLLPLWSAPVLLFSLAARFWLALEIAGLLGDKAAPKRLHLLPLQDFISFASWIGGFLGREIVWRNERYRLYKGGRFVLVSPRR